MGIRENSDMTLWSASSQQVVVTPGSKQSEAQSAGCLWIEKLIWMFPKIGVLYPQIIHFNRGFPYKPSIIFGTTHIGQWMLGISESVIVASEDVVQPDELHVVISMWPKVKPLSSTSQQSLQLQKGEMVQLHLRLQVGFVFWLVQRWGIYFFAY